VTVEKALHELLLAPRRAVVCLVRCYQATLSRIVGQQCRFIPTCSEYFIQAVEAYGVLRGGLKGLWRIVRCNPLSKGGYDPPCGTVGGESSD